MAKSLEQVLESLPPDEREAIAKKLATWCDQGLADVVLTTGGTGLGARDVTPEATRGIGERDVPGIPAALMSAGSSVVEDTELFRRLGNRAGRR